MTRISRRQFLALGGASLFAALGIGLTEQGRLLSAFRGFEFETLEQSTGLRRDLWPIPSHNSGWHKYSGNPVLGGALGVCFDVSVLKGPPGFEMWFSWRTREGIGQCVSGDGAHWTDIALVLPPSSLNSWKAKVNRPKVIKTGNLYRMWYTGQSLKYSAIGLAESKDGVTWIDVGEGPVFSAARLWEKGSVMAPDVMWDSAAGKYRMWYSAGGQFEPVAIGYAESPDGIAWSRHPEPVFLPSALAFDSNRVTACNVIIDNGTYRMFYVGFRDIEEAAICMASSPNGIDNWVRSPLNPIIQPGTGKSDWDYDAVYKPSVIKTRRGWMLWYNGRRGRIEQIGLACHPQLEFNV